MTILSEKRLILHITHQLPISDEKMLLLSWKSEEAYLVRNFFVYLNDKIPPIFSNWEPMLITFFRSESHHRTHPPNPFSTKIQINNDWIFSNWERATGQ